MNLVSLPIQHQRYLAPPCNNSIVVTNLSAKTRDLLCELEKFMKFFSRRYAILEENVTAELSVLSQFLYKNHNRFRNDKAQKFLKMIQKSCARFWSELSLGQELTKFYGVYPVLLDIKNKDKLYLPTKEMLRFILARFYGGANLLWKIVMYCQHAGELCVGRIKLGHFWNIGLNNLSCVSRLWSLTISTLILVEKIYQSLVLLLPVFPANTNMPTKLCDNDFPVNIAQVITQEDCSSFLEKFKKFVNIGHLPKFIHDSASTNDVVGQIEFGLTVDAGKVICRSEDAGNPLCPPTENQDDDKDFDGKSNPLEIHADNKLVEKMEFPCSAKKWKRLNVSISNHTKDIKALQSFVNEENKIRKTSRTNALTKMLGQDQWKALRNDLNILLTKYATYDDNAKQIKTLRKSKNLILCWLLYPQLKGMKPKNWKNIVSHFASDV